jgi:hypothetical protein
MPFLPILWERHLAAISSHLRHLTSQYFFIADTNFQGLSASGQPIARNINRYWNEVGQ